MLNRLHALKSALFKGAREAVYEYRLARAVQEARKHTAELARERWAAALDEERE